MLAISAVFSLLTVWSTLWNFLGVEYGSQPLDVGPFCSGKSTWRLHRAVLRWGYAPAASVVWLLAVFAKGSKIAQTLLP